MSQPARVLFLMMALFVAVDGIAHHSWWEIACGVTLIVFWIYFIARAAVSGEVVE